jgi:phage gpG-like protein
MLTLRIDQKQFAAQLGNVNKQIEQATNNRQFQKEVGQLLSSRGKQNLEDGGAGNKSYQLLAPSTLKQKARNKQSLKPLQREGLMRESIIYEIAGGIYLSGLDIIKHHQFGAPRANIPQREVFTIENDDYLDIHDFLINKII